jgi:hypothetical protein
VSEYQQKPWEKKKKKNKMQTETLRKWRACLWVLLLMREFREKRKTTKRTVCVGVCVCVRVRVCMSVGVCVYVGDS